jgi:hypothetical protein
MTVKEEEIDLTGITCNEGTPTLSNITKAKREIGRQLQNKVCADPDSKDHGQSYLIYDDVEWLKKKAVTDVVKPPTNPGTYSGTSHKLYEEEGTSRWIQTKILHWRQGN